MSTQGRARRRSAVYALGGWLVLLGVGLTLRNCGVPQDSSEHQESQRLRQEVLLLREENAALRERVGLLDNLPDRISGFETIAARMHHFPDLSSGRRSATLDIGSQHGVAPQQAVICDSGIVGIIEDVGPEHSRLIFADDPAFRVHFHRQGAEGEGIAAGGAGAGVLVPLFLENRFSFEDGEVLITGGRGGVFPRGLVIGTVEEVGNTPQDTRIRTVVRFEQLRNVVVLKPTGLGKRQ